MRDVDLFCYRHTDLHCAFLNQEVADGRQEVLLIVPCPEGPFLILPLFSVRTRDDG